MKILVFLSLSIFSISSYACSMPNGGKRYDRLIKLKNIGHNEYRVIVPRKIKNLPNLSIALIYPENDMGEKQIVENLEPTYKNNKAIAYFTVGKRGKEKPYIHATWWPELCCGCSTYANSRRIKVRPKKQ